MDERDVELQALRRVVEILEEENADLKEKLTELIVEIRARLREIEERFNLFGDF